MLQLTEPILITFGVLTWALACLWLPRSSRMPRFWSVPLLVAVLLGLYYGFLQPIAIFSITLFGLACFVWTRPTENKTLKALSGSVVLILAIALFLHAMPGFSNPKIISGLMLTADAYPYNKYLNFDSALIGLGILGFGHRRLTGLKEWRVMLKRSMPIIFLTLLVVMLLSLSLGYVRWQPKWTPLFLVWAWGNMFFTCIAEEAFFRGFIQKNLLSILSGIKEGAVIALLIASVLFGLAHLAGGVYYMLLATVAGLGYGLAYHRTQCIEAGILTHFTLNSLHFLLFTYPVLA